MANLLRTFQAAEIFPCTVAKSKILDQYFFRVRGAVDLQVDPNSAVSRAPLFISEIIVSTFARLFFG